MSRKINFAEGEFYHLYNRGVEKRPTFFHISDYKRFIMLLYFANQVAPIDISQRGWTVDDIGRHRDGEPLVDISAYCLMTNHYHLLIREKKQGGISKFMHKFSTGYMMYMNQRYKRSGALFEGRFKAKHVDSDRYLAYLVAYIHLNPVKNVEPTWKKTGIWDKRKAEQYLGTYQYSSYLDYLGLDRKEAAILSKGSIPEYFTQGMDFKRFVAEWLQ